MKKAFGTPIASAIAVVLSVSASVADVIELRADYWCPFNCDPNSDRPGFMVEIATEAMAIFGHEVNYETLNWGRSLEYVHSGRITGIIGTDEDEAPDLVFGPAIASYQEAAAFRPGETRGIETLEEIQGLRIGGIKGYEYSEVVAEYLEENQADRGLVQLVSGDSALEQNLRKLMAKRVDMVPEERSVLAYTLSNLGLTDSVDVVLAQEVSDLFIAFSPELPASETYAAQLTQGVEQLRASGRLADILSKYGLVQR